MLGLNLNKAPLYSTPAFQHFGITALFLAQEKAAQKHTVPKYPTYTSYIIHSFFFHSFSTA